jgi:hypothetical protein
MIDGIRGGGGPCAPECTGACVADYMNALTRVRDAAPNLAETVASEPERTAAAVAAEAGRIYRAATVALDDYLAADSALLDAIGRGEVIDEYHPLILARMRRLEYLRGLLTPETTT